MKVFIFSMQAYVCGGRALTITLFTFASPLESCHVYTIFQLLNSQRGTRKSLSNVNLLWIQTTKLLILALDSNYKTFDS